MGYLDIYVVIIKQKNNKLTHCDHYSTVLTNTDVKFTNSTLELLFSGIFPVKLMFS